MLVFFKLLLNSLQAHSYRTFQGITCLMQISTSDTDYIIDTLELWDLLHSLNDVFCNPKIVKVIDLKILRYKEPVNQYIIHFLIDFSWS